MTLSLNAIPYLVYHRQWSHLVIGYIVQPLFQPRKGSSVKCSLQLGNRKKYRMPEAGFRLVFIVLNHVIIIIFIMFLLLVCLFVVCFVLSKNYNQINNTTTTNKINKIVITNIQQ